MTVLPSLSALDDSELFGSFPAKGLLLLTTVITPKSAVHDYTRRSEVFSKSDFGRRAFGSDQRWNSWSGHSGLRTVGVQHRCPDQAAQKNRQGQENAAEDQLRGVIPATTNHRKNQQQHRQRC